MPRNKALIFGLGVAGLTAITLREPIRHVLRERRLHDEMQEQRRAQHQANEIQRYREAEVVASVELEERGRRQRRLFSVVMVATLLVTIAAGVLLGVNSILPTPDRYREAAIDYQPNLARNVIRVRVVRGDLETMVSHIERVIDVRGEQDATNRWGYSRQFYDLNHDQAVAIANLHSQPYQLSANYRKFPYIFNIDKPGTSGTYSFRVVVSEMKPRPVVFDIGRGAIILGAIVLISTFMIKLIMFSATSQREQLHELTYQRLQAQTT